MSDIVYPASMATDEEKYLAVCSLIEQARLVHNTQGAIARSGWDTLKPKWATYRQKYRAMVNPLLREKCRLRKLIRDSLMPLSEFRKLSDSDKSDFMAEHFGSTPEPTTEASFDQLESLKKIKVPELGRAALIDPYEDFTTFEEVDPSGWITVSDSVTVGSHVRRNYQGYLRKDYGAGHFGNLDHTIKCILTSWTGASANMIWWALTSSPGVVTNQDMGDNSEGMYIGSYAQPSVDQIACQDFVDGDYDIWNFGGEPVTYWYNVQRSGTSFDVYIYDDEGMTNLVHTLSMTANAATYRYLFVVMCRDTAISDGYYVSSVEDLDLQESPAPTPGGGPGPAAVTIALASASGSLDKA